MKITDVKQKCPECGLIETVGESVCEGDITPDDDDGCLCCSRCWYVRKKKVIMKEIG